MGGTMMPFKPEQLLPALRSLPSSGRWWVAYSGGADSTALLHLLKQLRPRLNASLRAFHVHHGLHPEAASWAEHCRKTCAAWDIKLQVTQVTVERTHDKGTEAAARASRYAAAAELLEAGDVLLTGHHAGDQAETLLLNLLRGSGVDGLAGMPALRPLGRGTLARPLLEIPGQQLRRYLRQHHIEWIEDHSNLQLEYDRNYMRHQLLPLMEARWPGSTDNLAISAGFCRDAAAYIGQCCAGQLAPCRVAPGILDLSRLDRSADVDTLSLGLLLRKWLQQEGASSLPRARLQEFLRQLHHAGRQGHAATEWDGWLLRHYRQWLWLQRADQLPPCPAVTWTTQRDLQLGGGLGTLCLSAPETRPSWRLDVGPRRGGERIACLDDGHHRAVKQILQERGIPPWLRACVPLVQAHGTVVAVGDFVLDQAFRTRLQKAGARLSWKPEDPALSALIEASRDTRG